MTYRWTDQVLLVYYCNWKHLSFVISFHIHKSSDLWFTARWVRHHEHMNITEWQKSAFKICEWVYVDYIIHAIVCIHR